MLQVRNINVELDYTEKGLRKKVGKLLRVPETDIQEIKVLRKSFDARHKPHILAVLTLLVSVQNEETVLAKNSKNANVALYEKKAYQIPKVQPIENPPVVVGFGPAGIFAAWVLAQAGLCPIVIERGSPVEERIQDVEHFRQTGELNPESNIQFGEGGAGTFSDGKLTTGIKDYRIRYVLETFCAFGAPKEILYLAKPHIGTNYLREIIRNIRKEIIRLGGKVLFHTKLKTIQQNNMEKILTVESNGELHQIKTDYCILAIGHSARDVYEFLAKEQYAMEPKPFSVGVRIEHKQEFIDKAMYGRVSEPPLLPAADYKMAVHLPNGRSLYTFCMCPGGTVVAAASQAGHLVVNGMSDFERNAENANSALLVGVNVEDYYHGSIFDGIHFQEAIERKAYEVGGSNYHAPCCTVGEFMKNKLSTKKSFIEPSYEPGVTSVLPQAYLPQFVTDTLRDGLQKMDRKIPGFANADAMLTGPETRSSAPLRILRGETLEAIDHAGIYPCGEGAGYAGGITSAAVDGMKCAEAILQAIQA